MCVCWSLNLVVIQEQEMEKQKLLFEQSRLSDRGAAEMVLMYISASKGRHHSSHVHQC